MGERTFRPAWKGPGRSAARPLVPTAARPLAVAIVVVCVLVTAVLERRSDTRRAPVGWTRRLTPNWWPAFGRHPLLLAMLVWPGAPVLVTAMAAALVLAFILRRRYGEALFVAISVPVAAAISERLLKPLVGPTAWGSLELSQRTCHRRGSPCNCRNAATRQGAREGATRTASCPRLHSIPDSSRRRIRRDRREHASLHRHRRGSRRRRWYGPSGRAHPRPAHSEVAASS